VVRKIEKNEAKAETKAKAYSLPKGRNRKGKQKSPNKTKEDNGKQVNEAQSKGKPRLQRNPRKRAAYSEVVGEEAFQKRAKIKTKSGVKIKEVKKPIEKNAVAAKSKPKEKEKDDSLGKALENVQIQKKKGKTAKMIETSSEGDEESVEKDSDPQGLQKARGQISQNKIKKLKSSPGIMHTDMGVDEEGFHWDRFDANATDEFEKAIIAIGDVECIAILAPNSDLNPNLSREMVGYFNCLIGKDEDYAAKNPNWVAEPYFGQWLPIYTANYQSARLAIDFGERIRRNNIKSTTAFNEIKTGTQLCYITISYKNTVLTNYYIKI
jgi:hypothetical protein